MNKQYSWAEKSGGLSRPMRRKLNRLGEEELAGATLVPLLPEWSPVGPFGQTAYALWLPQSHLPPKIRVFVDFLAARLQETSPE